jgi:inner membrane protein
MDPITHSLTGATIYYLGFRRKFAMVVLILASIAPDFDYVTRLWGMDIFLRYHRGITHGILFLFIVPLIIGLIFGLRKGFLYYTFIAFLGYTAHLLLDLANQYGTRILSPFDWQQYSLDLTFIIDPYITIGLLLSVILCRLNRLNKKRTFAIASITVMLLIAYIVGRYYLQGKTKDFLKEKLDANTYTLYPLPNDFLRWWFVVRSGDVIEVGFADLFTQRICIQETYRKTDKDLFIEHSKETRVVHNFLYFAKYPYPQVRIDNDRTVVIWHELAYSFMAGEHFVAKVVFDREGKLLNSYFKF